MRLESDTIAFNPTLQDEMTGATENFTDFQEILAAGIAAAQSGDRVAARRLLFRASGIDPLCEDVWMWLASISDYPEELLIFLGNALDINPNNERAIEWRAATRSLLAKTFVQRAAAAHQEGSFEQAQRSIEHALAFDAKCELAWLWKASLADDENEKIGYLEKVLEIDPGNPDARSALDAILTARSRSAFNDVRSAAAAGRRKKALELVDEFLRSEPNIADAWILRSHLSLSIGDKIESLQKALEIDPDNATARSAYDFLAATVGTSTDADSGTAVTSEHELEPVSSDHVPELERTGNDPVEIEQPEPELIEKPLDLVFDEETPAITGETEEASDVLDTGNNEFSNDEEPFSVQPLIHAVDPDDSFADPSPSQFENTFLEAFEPQLDDHYPMPEPEEAASDELQILDLQEAREYEYQADTSASLDTSGVGPDLASVDPPQEPLEF